MNNIIEQIKEKLQLNEKDIKFFQNSIENIKAKRATKIKKNEIENDKNE